MLVIFIIAISVGFGIAYPQKTGNARALGSGISDEHDTRASFLWDFKKFVSLPVEVSAGGGQNGCTYKGDIQAETESSIERSADFGSSRLKFIWYWKYLEKQYF